MTALILTSAPHYDFVQGTAKSTESVVVVGPSYYPLDYDIGISFMHLHKVPKEQLSKPWFNFHPGPLPMYKGRNLCYHAIKRGAKEFGATIHYMNEGFDTGDIIEVRKFDVEDWMTAGDLSERVMDASRSLFVEYLPRIIAGEWFEPLPNNGGAYYRKSPIKEFVWLSQKQEREIKAITCGDFFPKVSIGGVTYKIVRSE